MKLYTIFCFILLTSLSLKGQTVYDTLIKYSDRSNWGNGEMQGIQYGTNTIDTTYTINDKVVPKYMYHANDVTIQKMIDGNGTFIVKTFDLNNKIISISLEKRNCYVGLYIEYYENGQCKIKGQYCELTDQETKTIKSNCPSAKDKIWRYYDNKGNPIKKEAYNRGVLQK